MNFGMDVFKRLRFSITLSRIAIAVFLLLAYGFNLVLCSRVLAPGHRSALLLALVAPLIIFALIICAQVLRRKAVEFRIEFVVCTAVLVIGVIYSSIFVPFAVPDEGAHFLWAYKMSNTLLLMGDASPMRVDDMNFVETVGSNQLSGAYYGQLREAFSLIAIDPTLVDSDMIGIYNPFSNRGPQVTLAPALGFAIARLIGLGTIPMIYMGRFFNLLYFVVLLFFALRIIPRGKRILAIVALLPMTLQQVSSLSYDAGILGMSFVLFALIIRAIVVEGLLKTKELVGMVVFAGLLAPCKVVYASMVLLVFFIPGKRFKNRPRRITFGVLVFAIPAILVASIMLMSIVTLASTQASEPGMRGYSLSAIVERPGWFLDMFVNTLYQCADFNFFTMLGYSLGSFQDGLFLPIAYFIPFLVIMLIAIVRKKNERPLRTGLRATMISLFCIVFLFITLSMFLAFTKIGATHIEGIQGRYLLPVLPLLLLGLQSGNIVNQKDFTFPLVYCEMVMSSFVACINFSIAITL